MFLTVQGTTPTGRPGPAWASTFTWRRYAEQMARIYSAVAEDRIPQPLCMQVPA